MKAKIPHAYGVRALRVRLLQRREQLESEVQSHVAAVRSDAAPEPGGDAATQYQLHEVDLAEAERDNAELRDINAALARIDSGDYGQCSKCGEPIPHARLEANPHALYCVACAAASEKARGAPAHPSL
jgi:RNA polymerase-binding protein DksA